MPSKSKKIVVASSSDSDSSSEEVKAPVVAKRARAASNASAASNSSAKKSKKVVKKVAKKESSSDSDDSSSEEKPAPKKAAAPAKKAAKKAAVVVPDSDSDSDSDDKPKKAAKKAASSSSDEDEGPKDDAKPAAVEEEDDADSDKKELFVKSLSFDTTEEGLRAHFEQYGALTKVKLISSMGRSKGIGFVEYEKHSDCKKALAESNGFTLDNRQITCEYSGQKPTQDGPTSGAAGESDTVFCGNLGFHTSEDAIYEFFGQAGSVKNVRIAMGDDGRAKGFCHVEFNSPADATAAMGLAGQMLDGRVPRLDLS